MLDKISNIMIIYMILEQFLYYTPSSLEFKL